MTGGTTETADSQGDLPESFAVVLGDYERHLRAERNLTENSIRAYTGDLTDLFEHAARYGLTSIEEIDLRVLRSWLAKLHSTGKARTTIARRATAARVFTAWLASTGRAANDAGAALATPKAHRTLPPVLRVDEAEQMLRTR